MCSDVVGAAAFLTLLANAVALLLEDPDCFDDEVEDIFEMSISSPVSSFSSR